MSRTLLSTIPLLLLGLASVGCQSDGGDDPNAPPRFSTELGAEEISGDLEADESPQEGGGVFD